MVDFQDVQYWRPATQLEATVRSQAASIDTCESSSRFMVVREVIPDTHNDSLRSQRYTLMQHGITNSMPGSFRVNRACDRSTTNDHGIVDVGKTSKVKKVHPPR